MIRDTACGGGWLIGLFGWLVGWFGWLVGLVGWFGLVWPVGWLQIKMKCNAQSQPSPTFSEHKYRVAVTQRTHHTAIILEYLQRGCSEIALSNL
jgi:hypothetical protein